ncbi:exodeoxyribonuclease VII large subunit [Arthrobacter sp. Y-9]|uniref:exodeoxyribonuclease VII large subunit n=1 Tax=Arthrobacter sp. Y-9 TaxID=3039385 RepID=UPI00241C2421|nr:exodeoxyribonuclease VII large subunit [Arthrobacter sp. Y-9]WFR83255.1 exodeoxyribonuclease VII large subunit [Arthrobacter sp. Y-9]
MSEPQDSLAALPATAGETSPDNPWPLRLLSEKLKAHIDRTPMAWVEGQIIELNHRGSASYLTLRDVDAEVSLPASIWANNLNRLDATLERGSRVVAQLKPEFWLKTGRLNMSVRDIRPVGLGDLLARIERLRQALAAEGLFADELKRPLPYLPHRIGLITGRDSDAKKDVLRNAALRWPAVEFDVREVAVQGVTAVGQVTAALLELDADPDVDVIVIARGGGSLEDLLPFSNEDLIRAVSRATTPVVSAIGHEADQPLLDYVADLRASTPTDAAKRIVPDVAEELAGLAYARDQMRRVIHQRVDRESERLEQLRSRPVLAQPLTMVDSRAEELRRLRQTSTTALTSALARGQDQITHLRAQLLALSPQKTLDRGYAVVHLEGGKDSGAIVRDPAQTEGGRDLLIRVAGGKFTAQATTPASSGTTARARKTTQQHKTTRQDKTGGDTASQDVRN